MLTTRKLGTQGLTVSLIGLGLMRDDIAPIPGTKRRKYLDENIGAANVSLTGDEMVALDEAGSPEKVLGARYAPAHQAMIDR